MHLSLSLSLIHALWLPARLLFRGVGGGARPLFAPRRRRRRVRRPLAAAVSLFSRCAPSACYERSSAPAQLGNAPLIARAAAPEFTTNERVYATAREKEQNLGQLTRAFASALLCFCARHGGGKLDGGGGSVFGGCWFETTCFRGIAFFE
jgi:hypothetical protein